jgi:Domain of unknown function (DUF4184)
MRDHLRLHVAIVAGRGQAPYDDTHLTLPVARETGGMPFTASHPAAVLPLVRRGRWVSAGLVTGSVAPDIPSFLPLGLTHDQTHPPAAILWPDGVLAVGLLLAWWVLLRPGLVPLWPAAAARSGRAAWHDPGLRRSRAALLAWLGWLVLSELVGLATHLGWDAFTHHDGYVARRWSPLQGAVAGHLVVDWLQAASSALGLAVVAAWVIVQWRREPTPVAPEPIGPALRVAVVATIAVLALAAASVEWVRVSGTTTHLQLWSMTTKAGGSAVLIGLGAWSVVWAAVRAHRSVVAAEPHSSAPADVS